MRTTVWMVGLVLLVGCQRNRARDCAPYAHDPVLDVCVCPEGTLRADGGADCIEYDGGTPISCAGGAPSVTVYADADGDGHGNPDTERLGCPGEPGTSMLGDDCDDACASCHPGGTEICDGEDNDCASGPDDTFGCVQGTTTACTTTCGTTGSGACSPECTMPAACAPPTETCNELDDDCDELVDEGVMSFSDPVDWSAIDGSQLRIDRTDDGFVAAWLDDAGIHAMTFDSAGAPSSAVVMLDARTSVAKLDIDASGDRLYGTFAVATTFPEEQVYVFSANLPTLSVNVAPRLIATLPGGAKTLRIAHSVATLVFYKPYMGLGVRVRAGFDLATSSFRESAPVNVSTSHFDVVASESSVGRIFIAYAAAPTEGEDYEIFAQAIDTLGAADGPTYRVTDDARHDASPRIVSQRDRIAIGWSSAADAASTTARVHMHSVVPTPGGAWTGGGSIDVDDIIALNHPFGIIPRAGGWVLINSVLTSDTSSELRAFAVSPDGSAFGSAATLREEGAWTLLAADPQSAMDGSGVVPLATDAGSVRGIMRRVGCGP